MVKVILKECFSSKKLLTGIKKLSFTEQPLLLILTNAVKTLLGTHDFQAFCASGSSVKDTVRTVSAAEITFLPFTKNGGEGLMKIKVTGNGFLYNMVRIIAGTLLEIGQGKREESAFTTAIETGIRKALGKTAQGKGLSLISVKYQ